MNCSLTNAQACFDWRSRELNDMEKRWRKKHKKHLSNRVPWIDCADRLRLGCSLVTSPDNQTCYSFGISLCCAGTVTCLFTMFGNASLCRLCHRTSDLKPGTTAALFGELQYTFRLHSNKNFTRFRKYPKKDKKADHFLSQRYIQALCRLTNFIPSSCHSFASTFWESFPAQAICAWVILRKSEMIFATHSPSFFSSSFSWKLT